jgi:ribosome-associated toxin RatA of RatAB toxin-antitoxin module
MKANRVNLKNSISEAEIYNRNIKWLFDFTQDFINRKKWDKQTSEIDFIGEYKELKKGAVVFTKSIEGVYMETEYLTFKPPTEISVKMLNKSQIFKDFIGTWNYSSNDSNMTELRITYSFNLKFPYNIIKHKISKKIKLNMTNKLSLLKEFLNESENKNELKQSI